MAKPQRSGTAAQLVPLLSTVSESEFQPLPWPLPEGVLAAACVFDLPATSDGIPSLLNSSYANDQSWGHFAADVIEGAVGKQATYHFRRGSSVKYLRVELLSADGPRPLPSEAATKVFLGVAELLAWDHAEVGNSWHSADGHALASRVLAVNTSSQPVAAPGSLFDALTSGQDWRIIQYVNKGILTHQPGSPPDILQEANTLRTAEQLTVRDAWRAFTLVRENPETWAAELWPKIGTAFAVKDDPACAALRAECLPVLMRHLAHSTPAIRDSAFSALYKWQQLDSQIDAVFALFQGAVHNLSIVTAAKQLGIPVRRLQEQAQNGKIGKKVARNYLFSEQELKNYPVVIRGRGRPSRKNQAH